MSNINEHFKSRFGFRLVACNYAEFTVITIESNKDAVK